MTLTKMFRPVLLFWKVINVTEMTESYERPEIDLRLAQRAEGIRVCQNGSSYIANRWHLSAEVIAIVEEALDQGLVCMLQRNHPRESNRLPGGTGADYLTFSLTPEHRWVFVLDMDSCPKRQAPARVKFNKTFKQILRRNSVFCSPEWRSPQELVVRTDELPKALEVTRPYWDSLGRMRGKAMERGKHDFFVDEEDLHAHIVQNWKTIPILKEMEIVGSHLLLGSLARRSGELDLLAKGTRDDLIVIELKNRAVMNTGGETPDQQLVRYLTHREVVQRAESERRTVRGILISQEMDHKLRLAVANSPFPIVAFEATKTDDGLILSELSRAASARSF